MNNEKKLELLNNTKMDLEYVQMVISDVKHFNKSREDENGHHYNCKGIVDGNKCSVCKGYTCFSCAVFCKKCSASAKSKKEFQRGHLTIGDYMGFNSSVGSSSESSLEFSSESSE